MEFEFDPSKNRTNLAKHGVSLALAGELDWEEALVWMDDLFEYGEMRMCALTPRADDLYYVSFVDRDEVRRVISLRTATPREVTLYARNV